MSKGLSPERGPKRYSKTNLNTFCKSTKFATFSGLAVDLALPLELTGEDLVVAGLDRSSEESPATWTDLAPVGGVLPRRLSTNLIHGKNV